MVQVLSRLRAAVSVLGNEGALANVVAEMGQAAAARHAIDQLEVRLALTVPARVPHAA
jgi:hypothetical protein